MVGAPLNLALTSSLLFSEHSGLPTWLSSATKLPPNPGDQAHHSYGYILVPLPEMPFLLLDSPQPISQDPGQMLSFLCVS